MAHPLSALSPQILQALFDRLPDTMFFIKDREARYVLVNRTMVKRSGKQRSEEVLGQTVEALFPGSFGRNTTLMDLQVIARGEGVQDKLELYHIPQTLALGSGMARPHWCLTHKLPLRDAGGQTVGLVGVSQDLAQPDERNVLYRQVARVAAYVEEHYGESLRIPHLARIADLSEDGLERGTRQVFGLTPKQLVMKVRLEAASRLLRQTSMTVTEVAHRCGYADHSAFTRVFRSAVGLTPTQYRRVQGGWADGDT
ncbi:AraC family transcriptional regulator [Deinococcus marmoris]|uniref:Transcriptional regulator, AraC family n=1 Tax=Deinococcus marmoris TaxID=249408 RepID=A0A1U7NUW3_9DEIO|nr:AraC family transcriptional regulator [Deinococcus marmoris]OLV16711.1 Transcriptional regulator, AraC family [Deinococcus marmoris]